MKPHLNNCAIILPTPARSAAKFHAIIAHETMALQTTDRQKTDKRATAYSEREREFTFAKNGSHDPDYAPFRRGLLFQS